MAYLWRTFACEDCGRETTRRRQNGEPLICLDCGISRSARNALKLAAEGELRRQMRAAQRQVR